MERMETAVLLSGGLDSSAALHRAHKIDHVKLARRLD